MSAYSTPMVYLKDYAPSPYRIEHAVLDFAIAPGQTRVSAQLTISPAPETPPGTPLRLDGEELTLKSIAIDGLPLKLVDYEAMPTGLVIAQPPTRKFVLETDVVIEPEKNTRLMGLYRSGGTWCTQCESEGFRRITYFLDRPDNLATFRVKVSADKSIAPVLLSNGNPIESGDLPDDRHYAVWDDPFPKPSYLFALVAGDLGSIHDNFTTMSGREVKLGIYCAHGREEECRYAMDALKRAMAWDERRFGREYDLDIFNIVAVSDFNFGAMENKGLNIFNDKLVFVKPETATDADYANVERVIAHEYFHNWTGDRITCRDWFQLCLKEGLTVYRDQEFTSDERSRPVKRIGDVRTLRAIQFPEDAGPLAHPARPDRYKEINNFYTATVYEKGAEIVRMLATLLGPEGFRRGMDLYFDRHDGQAGTIEEFLKCFADANHVDLVQFSKWYDQAGTPEVTAEDEWDEASRTYKLRLRQKTPPTPGQPVKEPMVIPVKYALIGPNGSPMEHGAVSGAEVRDELIIFDREEAELVFEAVANRPVPSLMRNFSAPVKLTTPLGEADKLFLARHDDDPFNRWQALQDVAMRLMIEAFAGHDWSAEAVGAFAGALEETAGSKSLDSAFKAQTVSLPAEAEVGRNIGENVDPDRVHAIRNRLIHDIVATAGAGLRRIYDATESGEAYAPDARQSGRRALRAAVLQLLVKAGMEGAPELAAGQYYGATNMTERFAALSAIVHSWTADAPTLLADFRRRFTDDPLVFDKWLSLNAVAPDPDVLPRIREILSAPDFPRNNPNRLRALVGAFAMNNPTQFARPDGAGFRFVAEFCADVDKRNPQVASRVLTSFRLWRNYEPTRRAAAEAALRQLETAGGLSRNLEDILGRTLAG